MVQPKAIVLLSGGLDSSTCLYIAKSLNFDVIALSIFYSQKNNIELEYAKKLVQYNQIKEHIIFNLDLSLIGGSALTSNIQIPKGGHDLYKQDFIPVTYVPARNLMFLSIATALAESRNSRDIFIGINALDYSGYPDCRPDFIKSFTETSKLATKAGREEKSIQIHTPLLNMNKAEIIKKAQSLNLSIDMTWSCYDPQYNLNNQDILPCMECDACLLRKKGIEESNNIQL